MSRLQYDVLVTEPVPLATSERVPNGDVRTWSPMTSTLIYGSSEAVLVDAQFTVGQGQQVIDWVKASDRRLTAIYITHGHGDHWLAAPMLLSAFPEAELLATRGTIEVMSLPSQSRAAFWDRLFPDQIPTDSVEAQQVPVEGLELEGEELRPVEVGHSDTDDTTVLWIPSIRLAVAGDVIYNGVHQYLSESQDGGRDAWRRAIDLVQDLDPTSVVAGHKNPARPDDPETISLTRQYLDDADRLIAESGTGREFFDAMLRLYPGWLNPGALWGGALSLFGEEA